MHANNELGTIQPLRAGNRKRIAAEAGRALSTTDAVQSAGKIPVDVWEIRRAPVVRLRP